jgi:hypothetical protein
MLDPAHKNTPGELKFDSLTEAGGKLSSRYLSVNHPTPARSGFKSC